MIRVEKKNYLKRQSKVDKVDKVYWLLEVNEISCKTNLQPYLIKACEIGHFSSNS